LFTKNVTYQISHQPSDFIHPTSFSHIAFAKLRKVESKTKEYVLFLPRRSKFAISDGKVTKNPTHFSNEREKVFVNDYQAIILRKKL